MKKTVHILAFFFLIFTMLFTSCVSNKKFAASEAKVNMLQKDSISTHNLLFDCNKDLQNITLENESLLNEYVQVQNDLKYLSTSSKMTIADQAKRLKVLQDMIQSQNEVMSKLENSIADALMNYKSDELSVFIKDGNVYVSLSEKLLFKSGSDEVNPQGKEALKTLANVLNNTKDITVVIVGHTDNVPIKNAKFTDNWDLSTSRATSIVRILTKDFGFDPKRITASGKGEYHPAKPNETVEGRTSNRRIEIILSPDLQQLYNILYQ